MSRSVIHKVIGLLAAVVVGIAVNAGAAVAQNASPLPNDPNAHGYIGLCDQAGHNVTGGSINTQPFIWKAVSSVQAPAAFQGYGENVDLVAYQPRPQVNPGEWSGQDLTAAAFYPVPSTPVAQATYLDEPLSAFIQAFPPMVDGLYVLRMHYGKLNYGLYNATYPSTTIQVTGDRWSVISGGLVDCSAKGISYEKLTGVAKPSQYLPRAAPSGEHIVPSGASTGPISASPSSVGPGGSPASPGSVSAISPAANTHSTGSSMTWLVWLLVGVVALLGAVVFLLSRRPRAGPKS